jgi:lipopolysaccharide biosynthesis regulator YciM
MPSRSKTFRVKIDIVLASLLFICGIFGFIYSVRTSIAQISYKKVKYGFFPGTRKEVPQIYNSIEASRKAFNAQKLYPQNYYFPSYAAFCSLENAYDADSREEHRQHIERAMHFSQLALNINPGEPEARMVYALALAEKGEVNESISYWESEVVKKEFWNPAHHEFLAKLYNRASDPENLKKAVNELPFIHDSELRKELIELKKILEK